jgi:hypothetical protein
VRTILEGRFRAKLRTIWPFRVFAPTRHFRVVMRKGVSTSFKSGRSAATSDALLALVRLLARQAAQDFVLDTPAQPDTRNNPQSQARK